jgi:hypothetical protein
VKSSPDDRFGSVRVGTTGVIHKLTGAHVQLSKGGLARVHLSARKSRSAELVWLLQAEELVRLAQSHAPSQGSPEPPKTEEPAQG